MAHREFVRRDDEPHPSISSTSPASSLPEIRCRMIGDTHLYATPCGFRKITYCDHTATGRANGMVEDVIASQVLPVLSNTHTSTSYTGWCSHNFLEEARGIVRDSIAGASDALHAVIMSGRGSTGVSNSLVHMLMPAAGSERGAAACTCSYPGCGRCYDTPLELFAHARTHNDGEGAA